MNVIVVDDERNALENLQAMLLAQPDVSGVRLFDDAEAAFAYLAEQSADAAFLDIEMYGESGLELARRIKTLRPGIGVVFVTGHPQYALDAFALHANGYLLKPATAERLRAELDNLKRLPAARPAQKRIRVQTFGNFEVFVDEKPLRFERSRSKEIFAYLVDRRGTSCSVRELAAVLFEDRAYDTALKNQMQTFVSSLQKNLHAAGIGEVLLKRYNSLSVDAAALDCDYYRFLQWDVEAVNQYAGEYMAQYSWAELRVAYMDRQWQNAER